MSVGGDLADIFRSAFEDWIPLVGDDARLGVQSDVFVGTPVVTGNLRDQETSSGQMDGTVYTAEFDSRADYSSFVDLGRGPVRPVNARVLHFYIGGREVFTHYAGPAEPRDFFVTKIPDLWPARIFESMHAIPLR